ncbi:unnamed protein product [Spirodela intermedia]|uniref:Uncharacterized protein n=1 Tax=Spirodela intermedia TaxID=51605 RepID=A0A7I8K3W2_SPIIN|nr:unnamed protein product [Spirodela intermedia]
MEAVNMKLYLENRCIMEENERLREKASVLRRENQILLSQLQHTCRFNSEKTSPGGGRADEYPAIPRPRCRRQRGRSDDP